MAERLQTGGPKINLSIKDLSNIETPNTEGVEHLRGYFPLLNRPIERAVVRGGTTNRATNEHIPQIPHDKVHMEILIGEERQQLEGAHTMGDASLVLYYKDNPAVVVSFSVCPQTETLTIHQFQAVNNHRGFRLFTGLNCPRLVAESLQSIAQHQQTPCSRIAMPIPEQILGIDHAIAQRSPMSQELTPGGPTDKYLALARQLGMQQQGDMLIREL